MFTSKNNCSADAPRPTGGEDFVLVSRNELASLGAPARLERKSRVDAVVSALTDEKGSLDPTTSTLALANSMRGSRNATKNLHSALSTTFAASGTVLAFRATDAGTATYTVTGLGVAGALGGVVIVANTSLRCIAGSARIRSIEIFPSNVNGTFANVGDVRWAADPVASVGKDEDKVLIVPDGVSSGGGLKFVPPNGSLAGSWRNLNNFATTTWFTFNATIGSIVYLTVDWTLTNNFLGPTQTIATTSSVGTFGYSFLDGSSKKLTPVGKNQIL